MGFKHGGLSHPKRRTISSSPCRFASATPKSRWAAVHHSTAGWWCTLRTKHVDASGTYLAIWPQLTPLTFNEFSCR
jgi:hypothetical protein